MRRIMILGAGVYQVPLIKRAKEMGLYTIVVSIPGNYPGFALADKVYYENTVDYETILRLAKKEQIDGIVTTGTDVAIITIGKVCDALGLRGVSAEGAAIACDKSLMKETYQNNDVRTATYRYVSVDTPLAQVGIICRDIKYPVIFKAIDSSGSRGITRVNEPAEIQGAIDAVKAVTHHESYLIERFLIGDEFGAQAFVQDGKLEFVLPHGDYVFVGDTGVPVGHYAPYNLPDMEKEIYRQTELAIKAMKLDNCAINADFILCDGEPYVLEIGARGGATNLVELVCLYYGFDYYEKILRVAMGEHVDFAPVGEKRVPNASHLLTSETNGTIEEILNENQIGVDGVCEVQFDYGVGEKVQKFHVGPDRIGHVIVTGESLKEAETNLKLAMSRITIRVNN